CRSTSRAASHAIAAPPRLRRRAACLSGLRTDASDQGLPMPRVKLSRFKVREPAPEALATYLISYPGHTLHFHPETLPPITSPALFGDDRPLVLDLGCGRGRFIIERAQQDPARNYAGIDFHQKSLWDAVNK